MAMRSWLTVICGVIMALASAPVHAAPSSPYADCAATTATYRFDHGLGPDWIISQRPVRTPAAPYPDGSIDGDTAGNVQPGAGVLHLLARRAGAGFTGSRVLSRDPLRYGCVEIAARLPRGRGLWPALWLRTPYDGTPTEGEIDMVEGFGSHPGVVMSTLHHWHAGSDANGRPGRGIAGVDRPFDCAKLVADKPRPALATRLALAAAKFAGEDRGGLGNWLFASADNECLLHAVAGNTDFTAGFHRYLLVWAPDRIVWAVDGHAYFTARAGIPQAAMMLVMSLSVGKLDGGTTADTPAMGDLQVSSVRIMRLKR